MQQRKPAGTGTRWVVKVGSALVTNEGRGLDHQAIGSWVEQIAELRKRGLEVVLVSSGAVAEGMSRLNWNRRPHALYELQAAAAVGQMGVVQAYESQFQRFGLHTAQVLLTHDDISNRQRYLNARSTLCTLLRLGVVPVVNENDTVAFEELRLGDNDTMGAMVANLIEADRLIILTDQQGLYDRDPRRHADAKLVREARANDPSLDSMAGDSAGSLGRGGMVTKIRAARRAALSGTTTILAHGREPNALIRLHDGERLGTLLLPEQESLAARKRWLASHVQVCGRLFLDEGAVRALGQGGGSLLPVGVTRVEGRFERGEIVACVAPDGREVARGLVNYDADASRRIAGEPSARIEELLGYVDEPELIHRDNLVMMDQAPKG